MHGRWAILVQGEQIDISEARLAFGEGSIQVRDVELLDGSRSPALMSDELALAADRVEARTIGVRLLEYLNGALFVRHANRRPLMAGPVVERTETGQWRRHHTMVRGGLENLDRVISGVSA
jgi:hypothetical protein